MALQNLHFVDEAMRLVHKGEERGIQLRILGSIAYRLHSPKYLHLFTEMDRELTDIDFAAERRQTQAIREFMAGQGYRADERVIVGTEGARHIYRHPQWPLHVDVFTDELYFCHPIPFKGRLHLDSPTITTTDLLLEKMQIVQINLKDIKDTMVLLLEHPVGEPAAGREYIDENYVAAIMASDWGFYYTFTNNLRSIPGHLPAFPAIGAHESDVIRGRVGKLLHKIENAPKSMKWKIRSKVGTRARWYQEVSGKGDIF